MSITFHPLTMETVRTSCGICHKIGPLPGSVNRGVGHACVYVDYPGNGPKEQELEAYAKLFALAPKLLEAIRKLLWPNVPSADDVALMVRMCGNHSSQESAIELVEQLREAQSFAKAVVAEITGAT